MVLNNFSLIFFTALGSIYTGEAREDHSGCVKINLGIVVIWSGNIIITDDITGQQTSRPCGSSNSKWVWFWE